MPAIAIRRIESDLPSDFDALIRAAEAEEVRNMRLRSAGWASGEQRFDGDGAALFGAFDNGQLVGIGGVTPEDRLAEPAMRMRRFYVLPTARRCGAGRQLARAAMERGFAAASVLTCNARATPLAAPFWEAMGFSPVSLPAVTHICRKS